MNSKKKAVKKVSDPVTVKIYKDRTVDALFIGDRGKQVTMSAKDHAQVERGFKGFLKAQEVLEKYYGQK
jgi:hypothetical protein